MDTSGIIFSDLLINNEEAFVNFFTSYYQENVLLINATISNLLQAIEMVKTSVSDEVATKFQIAWADFQQKVLLNQQPLQLIVGYRDEANGHNLQISKIINQQDAESNMMINAGSNAVKDAVKALEATKVEEVFQHHLNSFLDTLYYDHLDNKRTAVLLNNSHKRYVPDGKQFNDIVNKNWQTIYYGSNKRYFGGQGLGQAYDAFMNHMANYHRQLYKYLSSQGAGFADIELIKSKVYGEEGGVFGTFPKLLYDSLNHQSWYSGGDIIIVNPVTQAVVYNIQLKTTSIMKGRIPTEFKIRLTKLENFLIRFQNAENATIKARELFQEFKTTVSNSNEFNNCANKTVDSLINMIEKQIKART